MLVLMMKCIRLCAHVFHSHSHLPTVTKSFTHSLIPLRHSRHLSLCRSFQINRLCVSDSVTGGSSISTLGGQGSPKNVVGHMLKYALYDL